MASASLRTLTLFSGLTTTMPEPDGPALWRVSDFDRLRSTSAAQSYADPQRQTLISTTLQAEMRLLDRRRDGADALEVVAACVRVHQPALIYLRCEDVVWPVTVFPTDMLYHSPRSLLRDARHRIAALKAIDIEPPVVRPPQHWMHERIADAEFYYPLLPMLWRLALDGPRSSLLHEIGGTAAYRALRSAPGRELPTPGALGPAVEQLHRQPMSLHRIASLPGMSIERASRLLNGLYLTSNLIVSRSHHAARSGALQWLFSHRSR